MAKQQRVKDKTSEGSANIKVERISNDAPVNAIVQ